MTREVTELDFRMPEFRNAKVEDYEFRSDGALVRKDRWETAIHSIRSLVGMTGREFEIKDVVNAIAKISEHARDWNSVDHSCVPYPDYWPEESRKVSVLHVDGSVLTNVTIKRVRDNGVTTKYTCTWNGVDFDSSQINAWKPMPKHEGQDASE